jgi:uncharacterized phage protein gp47/JayE
MADDNIPTSKDIYDSLIASFENNFGREVPILRKSFLRVLSKVLSAVFIILYKYTGFLGLQLFVSTASSKETVINGRTIVPLIEIGRQYGVGDPAAAVSAKLTVDITVTNQIGFIASGTQLLNTTNGITYITEGSIILDAATVSGTIVAASDQSGGDGSGAIGNLDSGATVSFINPLSNVLQNTIVADTIVRGVDAEDIDTEYRQRVAERVGSTPQGGALVDYIIWATEVDGIINAYPYRGQPGEVDVFVEATPESSGSEDGIPTQAQLIAVDESMQRDAETNIASRRPVGAFSVAFPIVRLAFDVNVIDLTVADAGATRDEIEQALKDYFFDLEPYIEGITFLPRQDRITLSAVVGIIEEVVSSKNGIFNYAELFLNDTKITSYNLAEGEKAKLGQIEFI